MIVVDPVVFNAIGMPGLALIAKRYEYVIILLPTRVYSHGI